MRRLVAVLIVVLALAAPAAAYASWSTLTYAGASADVAAHGCQVTATGVAGHVLIVRCSGPRWATLTWHFYSGSNPPTVTVLCTYHACRYPPTVTRLGRLHGSTYIYTVTQRVHYNAIASVTATAR
jgi:hypothetical protein